MAAILNKDENIPVSEGRDLDGKVRAVDAQRWRRIEDLFAEASGLDPDARSRLLERVGADDPDLRREVASLLAADEGGDGLTGTWPGLAGLLAAGPDDPDDPAAGDGLVGQALGDCRILRRLAVGGMGAVYLAQQSKDRLRRTVAVKVLKRGLDTEQVLARFATEQRILAALEHPGVARLYDAGSTGDGRPYFVMEYVDGTPLDAHCRDRDVGLDGRLDLFLEVCAAVQEAHRNLVVHRDLKPSNILVTAEGRVKLLDFGIAKTLDPAGDATPPTLPGLRPMTPGFAAPEQIAGGPITTAVDIYGLGRLLHLLLAEADLGHRAADVPPSQCNPRRRRRLRGDLDTIVMVALRREPERRYGSVQALADDVARHRADRPIAARRDTIRYVVGKFVHRNRAAVTVALVALTVVVAFAAGMAGLAHRNARQAELISRERDRSAEVASLLVDMFSVADPLAATPVRPDTLRVGDFLRQRAASALDRLGDRPQIEAELAHLLARLHGNLGRPEEALPLIERSVALRRRLHPDGHPELALSLDYLGTVRQELGEYQAALPLFEEALAMRRRTLGDRHPDVAESLNNLGVALHHLGRGEESLDRSREALALRRGILGDDHLDVAQGLHNLGAQLYVAGDLDGAEPLIRQALAIRSRRLGDGHPYVANSLSNLARLLRDRGRLAEAEDLFGRSLAIWREAFGPQHPQMSGGYYNLGLVRDLRGDLAGAAEALGAGHAIDAAILPPDHVHIADSGLELGRVLLALGRPEDAVEVLGRSLAIYRGRRPAGDPDLARAAELHARGLAALSGAGGPGP